jgi:hypothetical protein
MLEGLKQKMLARIEENAIKSELNGEIVYLKQSKLPLIGDWGRIYPPVNEDGSWNIMNLIFGGKKNFFILLIMLAIAGMILYQFNLFIEYIEYLKSLPCVQNCIELMKETPTFFP